MHVLTLLLRRPRLLALTAVALAAAGCATARELSSPAGSRAAAAPVNVFPIPGARVAAPTTQLTFRGVPTTELGPITVTGSRSGVHAGRVQADSDGKGGSFLPAKPFDPGETVTVKTGLDIVGGSNGTYRFTVADPAGPIRVSAPRRAARVRGDVDHFVSAPQLRPAAVRVIKRGRRVAPGDLFVAPQAGPLRYGPEILGPDGHLIWFKSVPRRETDTDFRVQTYQGKPVLTWWQGTVNGGVGTGQDEIYTDSYRPLATVRAGNGVRADLHEFKLTSQNTALVTAYYPVYWNASSAKHGSRHQLVLDAIAQEIDIPTGLVLWQWDSLDHVPVAESHQPVPTVKGHPWDFFHINTINEDSDGSILISSRNTWTVYDVSHQTGAINWRIGGKRSNFKLSARAVFAFQHDALPLGNNKLTIFDNGGGPPDVHRQSRALTIRVNRRTKRVTAVRVDDHRPPVVAHAEGSVQPQPNRDEFVGWGPDYLSEYNPRGKLVFDARFVGENSSYRAYRFRFSGMPHTRPSVAARVRRGRTTVYASWNGATRVARWQILGGRSAGSLRPVTSARRSGFETAIRLPRSEAFVAARALGAHGKVLGTSKPRKTP